METGPIRMERTNRRRESDAAAGRRAGTARLACALFGLQALWICTAASGGTTDPSGKLPPPAEKKVRRLEEQLHQREAALDSLLDVPAAPESLLEPEAIEEIQKAREEVQREAERLGEDAARQAEELQRHRFGRLPGHHKTVAFNMIRFGEDVTVRSGEVVQGDAVIVAGSLSVDGEVDGDAVVLGGNLNVGRGAVIHGQAVAIGGHVDTSPGAQIEGQTVGLTLFPRRTSWFTDPWPPWFSLLANVIKIGFLMLIAGLLLAIVPDRLSRAEHVLATSFVKCFGIGLLVLTGGCFALVVSVALLAITIIGLPAAFFVVFSTGVLLVASLLLGAQRIGGGLAEALRLPPRVVWIRVLLGLVLVLLPEIVADLLHSEPPFALGHLWLSLLSWALLTAAVASGLGALVLSKLGAPAGAPPQPAR
jgi:hypothetical protein